MMRGPIDYIIVGSEGLKFDGSILRALEAPINSGVISLVALSAINKDADGNVTALDIASDGDDYLMEFTQKYALDSNAVTQDDIDEVAELLEPNTAAGFLVIEQLWAKPLKRALLDANAYLIAEGRIHPDAAAELNEEV
jgi:hypothetical protein